MTDTPNPGSDEAIKAGCLCPIIDNGHGRGYMGQPDVFVITVGCPVHHPLPDEAGEEERKP